MRLPSQLTVDLDAVAHNLRQVRARVGDRAIMAAVKANAYGHGAVGISRHIQDHSLAEMLGVAHVAEALELRDAGITMPIVKLSHTFSDDAAPGLDADVILTLDADDSIRDVMRTAEAKGVVGKVMLKVDTGMRRIGVEPEETLRCARLLAESPHIELLGLMTHLPISDVPEGVDFTRHQLDQIQDLASQVEAVAGPMRYISAANSGAILTHDLGATSLVRPGIMMYGAYPDAAMPHDADLRPVATWASRLAFVKKIRAGETVGYGRTWAAERDTWIGTVSVGYGDGYSRRLSNKGRMLVGGRSYPVVGRVCMDQTMLDLGPERPDVAVGDEVVVIGRQGEEEITVEEVALGMETIPYEVTCDISARVPRACR